MWDVVWTDPDKELVGERRVRKAKSRSERHTSESNHNERHSIATESSFSSQDSPFALFRCKAKRSREHPKGSNIAAQPKTPSLSSAVPPSLLSSISPFSKSFDFESRRNSAAVTSAPTSPREDHVSSCGTHQSGSTKRTTIESFPLPEFDGNKSSKIYKEYEDDLSLPDTSCSQPRCSNELATISQAQGDGQMSEMEKTGRLMQLLHELSSRNALSITRPLSPDGPRGSWDGSMGIEVASVTVNDGLTSSPRSPRKAGPQRLLESPIFPAPPPKSPLRRAQQNNIACWRPPAKWNGNEADREEHSKCKGTGSIEPPPTSTKASLELKLLQMDISNMATASPAVATHRMRLLWNEDIQTLSKSEHCIERQQWMLSTLQNINHDAYDIMRNKRLQDDVGGEQQVTLILHESPDIVRSLSLLDPTKQFHGITDINSQHTSPTILPALPNGMEQFHTVFSLSLFSQWKMKDIPQVLRRVHQCLRTDGAFRVTVVDPLPCIHTLGEHLLSWMNNYLLRNIEEKEFVKEPCRILPKYLGEASLRGRGSKCTRTKFYALPENARSLQCDPDPSLERLRGELETKAELRSLIGRVLWMEIWGRLVSPKPTQWWWEDESCIEECRSLGTFWEFHVIDAVKMEL